MGSGAETARDDRGALQRGGETGRRAAGAAVPAVLGRSASSPRCPPSCSAVAVLEQTKEPGAAGEPLYLDVVTTLAQAPARGDARRHAARHRRPLRPVVRRTSARPWPRPSSTSWRKPAAANGFTVGIDDDVSQLSLAVDPRFTIEPEDVVRAVFFGLGSDGTVGANKNSVKIIAEDAGDLRAGLLRLRFAQVGRADDLAFALRAAADPRAVPDPIGRVSWPAISSHFLERFDVLRARRPGRDVPAEHALRARAPFGTSSPRSVQQQILAKRLRLFVIDASKVARDAGLGARINTVLQTCFFAISGVLPRDEAIRRIKQSIEKSYGDKGAEVVRMNFAAVDRALASLFEVPIPATATSRLERQPIVPPSAPAFVREVTALMMAGRGDEIRVGQMPVDGTFPSGSAAFEKRNISETVAALGPRAVHSMRTVRFGLSAQRHPGEVLR